MPTAPAAAHALAGVFGRVVPRDRARLNTAVGAIGATIADDRLLAATDLPATSDGLPGHSRSVRCLFAGALYCVPELARDLRVDPALRPEALLALAYERWEGGMLDRIRGDFTLLIWDAARSRGLLARDQLGTGSVFVHDAHGRLAFATEIVELLALLPRRPAPDDAGVLHWLTAVGSRPDLTAFAGVRQLPPGWCVRLVAGGWRLERYWVPRPSACRLRTRTDAVAALRPVLDDAVNRRLDATGSTGVLMSGGLDSAGVAGIASRLRPGETAAYSEVFPEQARVDESGWIALLSSQLGLPSTRLEVGAQGLVREALATIDRWAVPPVSHNFWGRPLPERAAEDGVRVLLTGDGGDELFAARRSAAADRLRRGRLLGAVQLARSQPMTIAYPPWRPILRFLLEAGVLPAAPPVVDAVHARLTSDPIARPVWLEPRAARLLDDTTRPPGGWKRVDGPRSWAESVDLLFDRVPAFGMFDNLRRLGRSTGVELRTPLFDIEVVRVALALEPALSFGGTLPKPVLRGALAGDVPEIVRLRPLKTEFNDVLVEAMRGPDRPLIDRLLGHPGAEVRRYARPAALHDLLARKPRSGTEAWRDAQTLWRLLGLECWLRAQEDPTATERLLALAPPRRFTLRKGPAEPDAERTSSVLPP